MKNGSPVLIEFSPATRPEEIKIMEMRRYKLVPPEMQQFAPWGDAGNDAGFLRCKLETGTHLA